MLRFESHNLLQNHNPANRLHKSLSRRPPYAPPHIPQRQAIFPSIAPSHHTGLIVTQHTQSVVLLIKASMDLRSRGVVPLRLRLMQPVKKPTDDNIPEAKVENEKKKKEQKVKKMKKSKKRGRRRKSSPVDMELFTYYPPSEDALDPGSSGLISTPDTECQPDSSSAVDTTPPSGCTTSTASQDGGTSLGAAVVPTNAAQHVTGDIILPVHSPPVPALGAAVGHTNAAEPVTGNVILTVHSPPVSAMAPAVMHTNAAQHVTEDVILPVHSPPVSAMPGRYTAAVPLKKRRMR